MNEDDDLTQVEGVHIPEGPRNAPPTHYHPPEQFEHVAVDAVAADGIALSFDTPQANRHIMLTQKLPGDEPWVYTALDLATAESFYLSLGERIALLRTNQARPEEPSDA